MEAAATGLVAEPGTLHGAHAGEASGPQTQRANAGEFRAEAGLFVAFIFGQRVCILVGGTRWL